MKRFLDLYQNLDINNIDSIREIYTEDITFIDPAHQITGIDNLEQYFTSLYSSLSSIHFTYIDPLRFSDKGYVQWKMAFAHPRLNKGREIEVDGTTFVQFTDDDLIYHHHDYFDLGSMLYQHIPVLGFAIEKIKRRMKT